MVGSDGNADCGQYPDACSGSNAYYNAVTREDDAGTEEADARDDLTDYAKIQGRLVVDAGERRESIGADADQDACPDADGLARYLPFEADYRSGNHCTENLLPVERRNIENGSKNIHC